MTCSARARRQSCEPTFRVREPSGDRLDDPLLVFVTAPDLDSLERRMRSRAAETEDEIVARLAEAEAELAEAGWFDLVIVNRDDSHDDAAEQLVRAIASARARGKHPR